MARFGMGRGKKVLEMESLFLFVDHTLISSDAPTMARAGSRDHNSDLPPQQ